jgi:1-acyl-sn-glycerol-3-phosphate acyltransferase
MLPFKRGGVLLAIRNGTPIIPVGIAGTRSVCPKGWHWPEQHPVAAVAGQPIDTSAYRSSDASILVDLIRSRILELRTEAVGLISQCESGTLIDTEHLEEQRQFAGSSRLN